MLIFNLNKSLVNANLNYVLDMFLIIKKMDTKLVNTYVRYERNISNFLKKIIRFILIFYTFIYLLFVLFRNI